MRVTAGPVELAYDVQGPEDAPPMVLLHGLGEGRGSWAGVIDRLSARHRTYAFDLRGHGGSSRPGEYSFALMEADVAAALDALGLGRVVLVGHSMGGNVAFRLAAHRPDLVGLLVVEDVIPPYPRTRPVPSRPDPPPDMDWACVGQIIREVGTEDAVLWDELRTIAAPTLLVAGGARSHIPQDLIADVAGLVPQAELVTVEAGHSVHENAPDDFAGVVLDWLSRWCREP